MQSLSSQHNRLPSPPQQPIRNITDIRRRSPLPVAEIPLIHAPRIIQPERFVNTPRVPLSANLLDAALEVLRSRLDHRGNVLLPSPSAQAPPHRIRATHLRKTMPPAKPRTPLALHQPRVRLAVGILRGLDADVARALLHDDAEDDALVHALALRTLDHGVPDAADVGGRVAGLRHGVFIGVEDVLEGLPGGFGGEGGGWAGVVRETHFEGWGLSGGGRWVRWLLVEGWT